MASRAGSLRCSKASRHAKSILYRSKKISKLAFSQINTEWFCGAYVATIGACSWMLRLLIPFVCPRKLAAGAPIRMSHSLTSPVALPDTSSRIPPRCMWTLTTHESWSFHLMTMLSLGGFLRSYTLMAPSPNPAMIKFPATCSDVKLVMQDPERAGMSYKQVNIVPPQVQEECSHSSTSPEAHPRP